MFRIKQLARRVLCVARGHDYKLIRESGFNIMGDYHSKRVFKCQKCGKILFTPKSRIDK